MIKVINDREISYSQWKIDVLAFIDNKMNQTLKNERKFRVTAASNMLFKVESTIKSWVVNLKEHVTVGYGKLMAYLAARQCLALLM